MKESKTSKFPITLAAVIIIGIAIAPLHVPGFAQSASTTNSSIGSGSNSAKTLRTGMEISRKH